MVISRGSVLRRSDDHDARDDVLERPRWRPWDDGMEAWLASSAAEF